MGLEVCSVGVQTSKGSARNSCFHTGDIYGTLKLITIKLTLVDYSTADP
jgi:hypothetical protein